MIDFTCHKCHTPLQASEKFIGIQTSCSKCGAVVIVPKKSEVPKTVIKKPERERTSTKEKIKVDPRTPEELIIERFPAFTFVRNENNFGQVFDSLLWGLFVLGILSPVIVAFLAPDSEGTWGWSEGVFVSVMMICAGLVRIRMMLRDIHNRMGAIAILLLNQEKD